MMDVAEARSPKKLEKKNNELRTMLTEALLKNRVLETVRENCKPRASRGAGPKIVVGGICSA